MRFFATALIFCGVVASYAQTPVVPHKVHFAGMTLVIRDEARREIQKDVDALTQSPKYFNIKAERAKTYFPIIEKIFNEERVPTDFKFLVLQESALISDAVSVSDAVGFWQFKDFTAREMGLRVDNEVDERMNIVSSTRGAAKYIKQNNFMFNNWVYALQAYQMGAGGVKRLVGDDLDGSRHMEITSDTYWYVKKFLAHKIAFEDAVSGEPQIKVTPYEVDKGVSLKKLAEESSVELERLKEYNKWVKKDRIPNDKSYTLIVPSGKFDKDFNTLLAAASTPAPAKADKKDEPIANIEKIYVNGVPAIDAKPGETLAALATRSGIDLGEFLKFNDISSAHKVMTGELYFLDKKRTKAVEDFHKVTAGEDLWKVSQHYGVQIKRLKKFNRLNSEKLAAGSMLWLNATKPKDGYSMPDLENVLEVEDEGVIDWAESYIEEKEEGNQSPHLSANASPVSVMPGAHLVAAGETLYSISRLYNLSVNDLKVLNESETAEGIKPGQILKVSVGEEVRPDTDTKTEKDIVHEVKSSETLYSVARHYGVTIKDLMEWNEKRELSVSVGEKLKIHPR